jgi:tetratricopeptide (TPR) repeat protein
MRTRTAHLSAGLTNPSPLPKHRVITRCLPRRAALPLTLLLLTFTPGCQPNTPDVLRQGFAALKSRPPNPTLALGAAQQQYQETPTGPLAAEALYLRGRAYEVYPARSQGESAAYLAAARTAYQQALANNPPPGLRAYILASLGNVSFFQEDFPTSYQSFHDAYGDLDTEDARAWALYRMAVCTQRLGNFEAADKIFADVQSRYPNTLQARRASESTGARAFYVRLGTYSSPIYAESASTGLRRQGFRGISIFQDPRGLYLLRLGPYPTYAEARDAQRQLSRTHPDALIMP